MDVPAKAKNTFLEECRTEIETTRAKINVDVIPFSNIWMASQLSGKLPDESILHVGILNSLRSWNYFNIPGSVHFQCNTCGFGIDGPISALVGASFNAPKKISFLVVGELAILYDLNALGNH